MLFGGLSFRGARRSPIGEGAAIRKGLDAARRGDFASDEEIAELFNRYRRTA